MPFRAARRLVHLLYCSPSPNVSPLSCFHICFPNLDRGLEETNIWVRVNSPSVWMCAHKNECVEDKLLLLYNLRMQNDLQRPTWVCVWAWTSVDNSIQILHKTLMRGRFRKWRQKHFNLSRCVTGVWWSCSWLLLARLSFSPFQLNPLKYDWSTCCPLLDRYSKFKWAAGQRKHTLFVTRWEQMSQYCQEHRKNVCGEMRKYIWIQIVSYCVTEMLW